MQSTILSIPKMILGMLKMVLSSLGDVECSCLTIGVKSSPPHHRREGI